MESPQIASTTIWGTLFGDHGEVVLLPLRKPNLYTLFYSKKLGFLYRVCKVLPIVPTVIGTLLFSSTFLLFLLGVILHSYLKKTGGFYVPPDVGISMESITFHTQAAL